MLVDENTKLIVHGITGNAGSLHTKGMIDYGTRIVGGVRPKSDVKEVHGVRVYENAREAVDATGGNASILFVPAAAAKQSALDAIDAGVKLVVIIPEHLPLHDTIEIMENARRKGARVVGPNTAGLISPIHRCKIGFVPDKFFTSGSVVVASRSGTLMYEMAARLNERRIGQRFCVGVGGDPVIGIRFAEILRMAEEDPKAKATILIGEIGGTQEEEAAELVRKGIVKKPVFAYIAGRYAPKDKTMGHAGAIVAGNTGTIESKLSAFKEAGIGVGITQDEVAQILDEKMGKALRLEG
jgi:succinyl-CoA synthetase alpha subunit